MEKDPYDDYIKWKKKEDSKWVKVSKQIKPVHIIGIFFIIFLGNSMVTSGKLSNSFFIGIIISFMALLVFLAYRETSEPKLIPEHIVKQIAQETLERKRTLGIEIPFDAKVRVTLVGEEIYETDFISGTSGTIRRDVGFEVIRKGYNKKGVIGIHPYSGIILGIRWEALGYTGKETKNRVIVPASVFKDISE